MAFLFSDGLNPLFQLQQALDAFRASKWLDDGPSGEGPYPPINVFRKDHDVIIVAEVPGIDKADLDVQIKGATVRIAGRKKLSPPEKASIHRRERLSGVFDRTVTLPVEVDADRAQAECRDGILALYLPRAEHDKPRSIKIA